MYGLPLDVDLSFFHERTLLQVCFGAHDLRLRFDGDVSVSVEAAIGCGEPAGAILKYDSFRDAATTLLTFLNQTVHAAEGNVSGTLTLRFKNGAAIAVFDDSVNYESYTINYEDKLIVV